ncbi:MAG: alpha/beta hydrolase [Magnetospirillum sp.]|nr:alpha/beta hydrolase [Magnetospirillum sp.]
MVKQSSIFACDSGAGSVRVQRLNEAAAGRPVVFLHEALGSIALWRDFPAALCARIARPGIVYERLGHGQSDPLPGPRAPRYLHDEAQALLALLDRLDVAEADLVGHSDGGSIALLAGAAAPDRFGSIVTIAAHVYVEELTLAGIRAAVELYKTTDLRRRLSRYHGAQTDALFAAWAETWLSAPFAAWNIEADLKTLTAPVLAVQGENDEYGTLDQLRRIGRAVGGSCETWEVPGAAHQPQFQAAEAMLARLAAFLEPHAPDLAL